MKEDKVEKYINVYILSWKIDIAYCSREELLLNMLFKCDKSIDYNVFTCHIQKDNVPLSWLKLSKYEWISNISEEVKRQLFDHIQKLYLQRLLGLYPSCMTIDDCKKLEKFCYNWTNDLICRYDLDNYDDIIFKNIFKYRCNINDNDLCSELERILAVKL